MQQAEAAQHDCEWRHGGGATRNYDATELDTGGLLMEAVGVALDPDSVRVRSFVAVNKPPMPIVQLVHPRWMDVFYTRVLPMMVVLDPDGRVRASRGGVPSDALIQDSIVPHLGQLLPTISPLLVRSTGCVE